MRCSARLSASARSAFPGRSRRRLRAPIPSPAARAELNGLDPDYVELLDLDGATLLAAAVRVGSIRLIDNVLVKGALA